MADEKKEQKDEVIPFEELWKPFEDDGTEFGLEGFVKGKYGGANYTNQDETNKHRSVVAHLLKKVGSNLLEGKSLINVSLPVFIFEPRSFLERLCDVWCYAPLYLTKAAKEKDHVERFKLAITFLIAGLHRGFKQQKPFNPILGETYQATFADGAQVFCEQVSHHPPISSFEVFGPHNLWMLHGHHEYMASFRPNGLIAGQNGPTFIDFSDGSRIAFDMPKVKMAGLVFGDRVMSYFDTVTFHDKKHKLRAEIVFDPDALSGLKSWIATAKTPADTFRGSLTHNNEELCTIEGSWLEELKFGDKQYWRMKQYKPYPAKPVHESMALPSDCRYREDLMALASGNVDQAQAQKERLEDIQRNDRKLRKDHETQKSKAAAAEPSSGNYNA